MDNGVKRYASEEYVKSLIPKKISDLENDSNFLIEQTQVDWNQNDESVSGYIKNRPFYKESNYTTVVEEQTVTFTASGNYAIATLTGTYLNYGETYRVTLDGIIYNEPSWQSNGEEDWLRITMEDGTNINIYSYISIYVYSSSWVDEQHTIKIEHIASNIIKIDEKFLPENIATTEDLEHKMNTSNPEGTGAFSLNRKGGTSIGVCSTTIGLSNIASYKGQFTSGRFNKNYAGNYTIILDDTVSPSMSTKSHTMYFADDYTFDDATGTLSLVNPVNIEIPSGAVSSDYNTYKNKYMLLDRTIISSGNGKLYYANRFFNQPDIDSVYVDIIAYRIICTAENYGQYVHIVGNGTADDARSNAHTLDWEGNAEYQGDVKANACGGENPISLVETNNSVNEAIANISNLPIKTITLSETPTYLSDLEVGLYKVVCSDEYTEIFISPTNTETEFTYGHNGSFFLLINSKTDTTMYGAYYYDSWGNLLSMFEYDITNDTVRENAILTTPGSESSAYKFLQANSTGMAVQWLPLGNSKSAYKTSNAFILSDCPGQYNYNGDYFKLQGYFKFFDTDTETQYLDHRVYAICYSPSDYNTAQTWYFFDNDKITCYNLDIENKTHTEYVITKTPTKVSELENDSGFLTEHQDLSGYATKSEIPTTLSQLSEDETHRVVSDEEKATWGAKVDIAQGSENYGKILIVDESGNLGITTAPASTDVTYNETEQRLELSSKTNLTGNVSIDPTLSISGEIAEAKAVGDAINEVNERIDNLEVTMKEYVDSSVSAVETSMNTHINNATVHIPTPTADDNNKILRVVDGVITWVALSNAEDEVF